MNRLHRKLFQEIVHHIAEIEDELRSAIPSDEWMVVKKRSLDRLYDKLLVYWPIIPGRGSDEECSCK